MGAASIFLLMTSLPACFQDEPAPADLPTIEEFIFSAPVLRDTDPDLRSLEVRLHVQMPPLNDYSARWLCRSPDQYWCCIRDALDETPIFWSNGRNDALYDPIRMRIVVGKMAVPALRIVDEEGDHIGVSGFSLPSDPQEPDRDDEKGRFFVDLRSILAERARERQLERTEAGNLFFRFVNERGITRLVTVERDGDRSRWVIESDRPGEMRAELVVAINEPIADQAFTFPEPAGVIDGISIDRLEEDLGILDEGTLSVENSLFARNAIRDPKVRAEIGDLNDDESIDWEQLEALDRKVSEQLRQLVGEEPGDGEPEP